MLSLELFDPNGILLLGFTFKLVSKTSSSGWDAKVEESIEDVSKKRVKEW